MWGWFEWGAGALAGCEKGRGVWGWFECGASALAGCEKGRGMWGWFEWGAGALAGCEKGRGMWGWFEWGVGALAGCEKGRGMEVPGQQRASSSVFEGKIQERLSSATWTSQSRQLAGYTTPRLNSALDRAASTLMSLLHTWLPKRSSVPGGSQAS
eukprot:363885-Chlamydomonas_euryale.AAC.23